jgi:hypothetical protein
MTTGDGDRVIPSSYLKQRLSLKYHLYVCTKLHSPKATALLSRIMTEVNQHLPQDRVTLLSASLPRRQPQK